MPITPQQINLWRSSSEHQHLEFKEAKNQFDFRKLCEYCVAIANEGGGYLLLGVADKPPRPVVGTQAFSNLVGVEEKVFRKLCFQVKVEEVKHPDGRVLVFHIPSRPRGTAYNLDGKYLMRSGSSLVPMTEDRLRVIFDEGKPAPNQSICVDLVAANLLGAWNEGNEADLEVVSQLVQKEYTARVPKVREIVNQSDSPVNLEEGRWCVSERKKVWQNLGANVFDGDLDNLKQCAVTVLSERDPQFELPPRERFTAVIQGKVLKYSPELRKGLAESLALLGTRPADLKRCSRNKREIAAASAVQEILKNADWVLWGSLDDLLPVLAEASPDEFLGAVENALQQTPCPFDKLFSQEEVGIFGRNYLTGLLWALETLAWDKNLLVRACVTLGELASRDPGGNWINRPINSLTTILLPWFPQTTAPIEKRKVALKNLREEVPKVAWKLLLSLLPDKTRTSSGTHKPSWRNTVPDNWQERVSQEEYQEQVSFYAKLTVEMASNDTDRLTELVGQLGSLPPSAFDHILKHLSSEVVSEKPEDQRVEIWTRLTKFARHHRKFSDEKWASSDEIVSKIESIAEKLAPQNPLFLHRRLFVEYDVDLYEEAGNLEEQQQKLEEKRQQAIRCILNYGGMDAVVQFVGDVKSPSRVGHSLGVVAEAEIDEQVLPALLEADNNKLVEFIGSYIWSRRCNNGWEWVDGLDRSGWSVSQMSKFLSCLPFTKEAWKRAAAWLGQSEGEYWTKIDANSPLSHDDFGMAVDKLIENGRPEFAICCLVKMLRDKKPLDRVQSIKALLAAVPLAESFNSMDGYYITEVIKALQNDPETNSEGLFRIEWAYLPLLVHQREDVSLKTLENRLASDPDFFCEAIRRVYRSKKEKIPKEEPSKQSQDIAWNALTLLDAWQTVPGTRPDGVFLPNQFKQWLEQAKKSCTESGHLEGAFISIGKVLIHSPPDPGGLWIHRVIANALNDRNADKMRRGYEMGVLNSRGVHGVDPAGKPERELAEQYRQKAETTENAGYQRFATTLRRLSEFYVREADRIIAGYGG